MVEGKEIYRYLATYTKQVTQKRKKWNDGYLVVNNRMLNLYEYDEDTECRGKLLESFRMKEAEPIPSTGDDFQMKYHIFSIETEIETDIKTMTKKPPPKVVDECIEKENIKPVINTKFTKSTRTVDKKFEIPRAREKTPVKEEAKRARNSPRSINLVSHNEKDDDEDLFGDWFQPNAKLPLTYVNIKENNVTSSIIKNESTEDNTKTNNSLKHIDILSKFKLGGKRFNNEPPKPISDNTQDPNPKFKIPKLSTNEQVASNENNSTDNINIKTNLSNAKSFKNITLSPHLHNKIDNLQLPITFTNRVQYTDGWIHVLYKEMMKLISEKIKTDARSVTNFIKCELVGKTTSHHSEIWNNLNKKRKNADNLPTETINSKNHHEIYIKIEDNMNKGTKADIKKDDLWILTEKRSTNILEILDISQTLFVVNKWQSISSQSMLLVETVPGICLTSGDMGKYKYALRLINISSFIMAFDNLFFYKGMSDLEEGGRLDEILHIGGHYDIFTPEHSNITDVEVLEEQFLVRKEKIKNESTNLEIVTGLVENILEEFKLNSDQTKILLECSKWFMKVDSDYPEGIYQDLIERNTLLIQGAFGSGKSFLLVALITFISKILSAFDDTTTKILVCSITNMAVDNVLLGLKNTGFDDFGRVGSMKKINRRLLGMHYSKSTGKDEIKELKDILKELENTYQRAEKCRKREIMEEINGVKGALQEVQNKSLKERKLALLEKRVIGVTCAATQFEIFNECKFDILFLDEASQMIEPQSLIPITKFGISKLILSGDPRQLPPLISYETNSAENRPSPLSVTLFDRLKLGGIHTLSLQTQYRCHPNIADVANALFYDGILINGVDEVEREAVLFGFGPITFINVYGKEKQMNSMSYLNNKEAEFLLSFTNYVINELECINHDISIGIIVLYKTQENLIKGWIRDKPKYQKLSTIQISTVDAFQGGERDIIIISCVRSNKLGFICDNKRLNVAITRAKRHLIIIGSGENLRKSKMWSFILDRSQCKSEKDYLPLFQQAIQ